MRGEHTRRRESSDDNWNTKRIIPACAGSTSGRSCEFRWAADHPRVRGEHPPSSPGSETFPGSSPRARGAREHSRGLPKTVRIIPACAGSTAGRRWARTGRTDHPRVRGEHTVETDIASTPRGSSPRAQGARHRRDPPHGQNRIIPACAGSTSRSSCRWSARTDHPRVRGEHQLVDSHVGPSSGSSPRARGALENLIYPALGDGSSPRARGAPENPRALQTTGGIIPACAGSTAPSSPLPSLGKDHPRVRGEHRSLRQRGPRWPGSSPRARGAHGVA